MVTLADIEARGFDREAWRLAVTSENQDAITLAHPSNWMTEEEVEQNVPLGVFGITIELKERN